MNINWKHIFLIALFGLVNMPSLDAQKVHNELVWSDEFNIDGSPDTANWNYEHGFVRNQEDQWYQQENAWCENGNLIIEARRETKPNPWYKAGSENWKTNRKNINYTSSCLLTSGKHQWKYGRMEMRAKIDIRPGMWPAFWTLGVDGEWPSNGECDIMEYYRGMILANFAWGSAQQFRAIWDDVKIPVGEFAANWADDYHVWKLDWNEDAMKIYVDDQLLNEVDLSNTINKSDGKNPFHQPHYMLINLAIGGANGGDPSNTEFPARYVIDYVRVYQEK